LQGKYVSSEPTIGLSQLPRLAAGAAKIAHIALSVIPSANDLHRTQHGLSVATVKQRKTRIGRRAAVNLKTVLASSVAKVTRVAWKITTLRVASTTT
jgi:hypothetical protein